jgi:hypothetical protein
VRYLDILAAPESGVEGTLVTEDRLEVWEATGYTLVDGEATTTAAAAALPRSGSLDPAALATVSSEREQAVFFDVAKATHLHIQPSHQAPPGAAAMNGLVDWTSGRVNEGHTLQYLVRNVDGDGLGWHVILQNYAPMAERTGAPRFPVRHQHPHEQLFVVLEGEMDYGDVHLATGTGVFVPRDVDFEFRPGPGVVRYLVLKAVFADRELGATITELDPARWQEAGWSLR